MTTAARQILIIQGHPDSSAEHFCHALASRYAEAARMAGHQVRTLEVAGLGLPPLQSKQDWERGDISQNLQRVRADISWANHLVIVYPLWLGCMPAALKAFFEQVMRPGFAIHAGKPGLNAGLLSGRSARVVVTMGMPGWFYRWYFGAHSLKCLKRNILNFTGIRPVGCSIIGQVEGDAGRRQRWLEKMDALGSEAI